MLHSHATTTPAAEQELEEEQFLLEGLRWAPQGLFKLCDVAKLVC